MDLHEIAGFAAALAFVAFAITNATSSTPRPGIWRIPAALSAAFAAWTIYAVATEGLLGFWPEHTRHAWGNQIWFDLLLAASVALAFLVPEARRQGMNPLPWSLVVIMTGSIGLLAMTARILHLKEANARAAR